MLASLALAVYLPAALARSALRGTVADGFAWREILGFIKANLGNYLLSLVIYLLASFLAQFGFLLCCVGIFPAAFWGYMVLAVALGQTVRLERSRSGSDEARTVRGRAALPRAGLRRSIPGLSRSATSVAGGGAGGRVDRGEGAPARALARPRPEREARRELHDPRERDPVGRQREGEAHVLRAPARDLVHEALRLEARDELGHRLEPQVELLGERLPAHGLAPREPRAIAAMSGRSHSGSAETSAPRGSLRSKTRPFMPCRVNAISRPKSTISQLR